MRRAGMLFLALILLVAPGASSAQPGASPPAFEHVHVLAFDAGGRTLWLGAHTGLYRSEDNGRTWAKASLPVQNHGPDVMTLNPKQARETYAAAAEGQIFVSSDGGQTWAPVR